MTNLAIKEVDVALALAHRDGKILLIQRKDKEEIWDKKWEFPGGKIEEEEQQESAIIRELREETGLEVLDQKFLGSHTHDWELSDRIIRVHLKLFYCEMDKGAVKHEEHSAYQTHWVTPKDALNYDLLEANHDILRKFMNSFSG